LALITAVLGRVTELMLVPVPHQGQLPVPAGMLVPKVIKSPPLTVPVFDIVTVLVATLIDETVVPDVIALGVVVSWIVIPGVIWVVTTPLGNVRTVAVAELTGVPASVTIAHVDPVLNSVAAVILVFKASVLVVVAALVVFTTPE
jgi:hypothetical protein